MRLIRFAPILVFACTSVAWSQTGALDEPALDPACQDEGKDPVCRHAFSTLAGFRAEHEAPPLAQNGPATTDVAHCFLDLELHFDTQTVSGTSTVTFRSLSDNLTTVSLDLDGDNMSGPLFVDAVTMGGAAVGYTRAGGKIDITLDRPYAAGESFAIAVTYHGSPQNAGYSSFTWVGHGSSVLASTLSEPWHASTWWPCRDELVDKFTMDMWLTVPAGMVGVSNGSLEGTDALPGNRLRYRWRESYPIVTYLVSLAVTNYVSWSQYYDHPGGSMPVVFYAYPESQSYVQANVADVLPAIQTFSQAGVYGEYPFVNEKYGIAQFAWSGGMEHQTITSQGAFIWWLNVHELAHQWWGDMVTCATWHDIWLNEGFASFSEALYEEKRPGGSFAAYKTRMQARRPASMGGSVYVYNAVSESAIFSSTNVYNKGAWAVHMLRHVLGDEAFFETLAAYRAAYEGGSATTDEFKAVAETVHGASLDWYFNEWIYGTGAPSYRWGWRDIMVEGQRWLALHVEQYQTHYDNFRMPIDITVTAGGSTRTHVIWQEHDFDWYALEVDGPVSNVQFDKDTWILREITSNVTYVPPPRLTATAPALGSAGMYLDKLDLTFSTGVTPAAADFSVTGSVSGNRAFTLSQPSSTAARLNFSAPLPGGQVWTVTVRETLSATSGLGQFDGEIADPANPGSLPSGNGLIGGDAVFTFSTAYPGDFDDDRDVDLENFGLLQRCLLGPGVTQTDPQCRAADINHDSFVDGEDLAIFQACLSGPGRSPPATCGI